MFLLKASPSSVAQADDAEMDRYRAPFTEAGEAPPHANMAAANSIAGEPADVVGTANYATFMAETDLPKLFINADPLNIGRQGARRIAGSGKTRRK